MKHLTILCTVVALIGAGCNKKKPEEAPAAAGSSAAMGSGGTMGSAMAGSGGAIDAKRMVKVPAGTSADYAQRFRACWDSWNAGKLDDFKACYTADSITDVPGSGEPEVKGSDAYIDRIKMFRTAFPDQKGTVELTMVSGKAIIAIVLMTGTNTGAMGPMQPTGKPIGVEIAMVADVDDAGHLVHESDFFDQATMMSQLTPGPRPVRPATAKPMLEEVAIATDDAREKANLDVFHQLSAAFDKHDRKAVDALLAGDVVWSEAAAPADAGKQAALDGLEALWKGFGNLTFKVTRSWAAGDFVAAVGSFEGTNQGALPMLGITKPTGKAVSLPVMAIYKLEGGKLEHAWMFYQSGSLVTQLGLGK